MSFITVARQSGVSILLDDGLTLSTKGVGLPAVDGWIGRLIGCAWPASEVSVRVSRRLPNGLGERKWATRDPRANRRDDGARSYEGTTRSSIVLMNSGTSSAAPTCLLHRPVRSPGVQSSGVRSTGDRSGTHRRAGARSGRAPEPRTRVARWRNSRGRSRCRETGSADPGGCYEADPGDLVVRDVPDVDRIPVRRSVLEYPFSRRRPRPVLGRADRQHLLVIGLCRVERHGAVRLCVYKNLLLLTHLSDSGSERNPRAKRPDRLYPKRTTVGRAR